MKKLGFGFKCLPLKNENDLTAVDVEKVNKMVDLFIENGFNYFDTSTNYLNGVSEKIIRESVVSRYPRDKIIISNKLPTFIVDGSYDLEVIFNKQLETCGVDYFDYYFLQLDSFSEEILTKENTYDFLKQMKEEGKIRNLGLYFLNQPSVFEKILLQHPEFDIVALSLNYYDWFDDGISSKRYYDIALKYDKKIMVRDPFKTRTLIDVPKKVHDLFKSYNKDRSMASWAIKYCASLDNVIMVISDMGKIEHVQNNVDSMKDFEPLTNEEINLVGQAREIIKDFNQIPCINCQKCLHVCPMDILITKYFDLYNTLKCSPGITRYSLKHYYNYYALNKQYRGAGECIGCNLCLEYCPVKIDIPKYLNQVSRYFDNLY